MKKVLYPRGQDPDSVIVAFPCYINYVDSIDIFHFLVLQEYWVLREYVLKRVSFGSKECTKELKLECAYFLGQTS